MRALIYLLSSCLFAALVVAFPPIVDVYAILATFSFISILVLTTFTIVAPTHRLLSTFKQDAKARAKFTLWEYAAITVSFWIVSYALFIVSWPILIAINLLNLLLYHCYLLPKLQN